MVIPRTTWHRYLMEQFIPICVLVSSHDALPPFVPVLVSSHDALPPFLCPPMTLSSATDFSPLKGKAGPLCL